MVKTMAVEVNYSMIFMHFLDDYKLFPKNYFKCVKCKIDKDEKSMFFTIKQCPIQSMSAPIIKFKYEKS